jgi:hypothetical protein
VVSTVSPFSIILKGFLVVKVITIFTLEGQRNDVTEFILKSSVLQVYDAAKFGGSSTFRRSIGRKACLLLLLISGLVFTSTMNIEAISSSETAGFL